MINLNDLDPNLLKIDKTSYKEIDIYYIGYITIKKIDVCDNIHSKSVVFNNSFCYRIF